MKQNIYTLKQCFIILEKYFDEIAGRSINPSAINDKKDHDEFINTEPINDIMLKRVNQNEYMIFIIAMKDDTIETMQIREINSVLGDYKIIEDPITFS